MIRRVLVAATLASLNVLAVDPCVAAPSVTVRYHRDELRSAQGVAGVYRRLQDAARQSCGQSAALDAWTVTSRSRCRSDTLEASVRRVGDARLASLHRACQRDATGPRCQRPGKQPAIPPTGGAR